MRVAKCLFYFLANCFVIVDVFLTTTTTAKREREKAEESAVKKVKINRKKETEVGEIL